MSQYFKNTTLYTNEQLEWINEFKKREHGRTINNYRSQSELRDLDDFKYVSQKYNEKENEVYHFFIREYLGGNIEVVESLNSLKPNEINKSPIFRYDNLTNKEILNRSIKNIESVYSEMKDENLVNGLLDYERNKNKISNISIDKNLSKFIILLIDKNLKLNHNAILNMSIRHGSKDLFNKVISKFSGEKENFDHIRDNPYFWQPLMLTKNNREMATYFSNELIKNNFKISMENLKSIKKLFEKDKFKIEHFNELENRLNFKTENKRKLKI